MSVPRVDEATATELLDRIRTGLPGGGEARPGQVQMVEEAALTFDEGGVVIVKAGTGTGKSFGALLPAIASGQRTVMVTSSIALQDQYVKKDLPFLAEHLPDRSFAFEVLKGRSNYVCRAKLAELLTSGVDGASNSSDKQLSFDANDLDEGAEAEQVLSIIEWAETTETGDRAELDFEPRHATWRSVSVGSDECPGARHCDYAETCFAEKAHERAGEADVVVVNANLYAANIAAGGWVLPEHDIVIFDEAHELEQIFSRALGDELTPGQIGALYRAAKRILTDERALEGLGFGENLLRSALHEIAHPGQADGGEGLAQDVRLPDGAEGNPELTLAIEEARRGADAVLLALKAVPDDAPAKDKARAERVAKIAKALREHIDSVAKGGEDRVIWTEGDSAIHMAPINVGTKLSGWFWGAIGRPPRTGPDAVDREEEDEYDEETEERVVEPPRTALFMSATVPATLASRLGAPKSRVVDVGSPFDFASNAMLYVPRLPDPRRGDAEWRAAAQDEIVALIEAAGGRTLALFTSIRAMREAVEVVRDQVSVPILVQGDKPKLALLRDFADDEASCLFATRSFFQGVDVPGASLSVVILDRIPFPRQGDPLIEAWVEAAGGQFEGWRRVCVPIAATTLAQAAGRLIRTETDRGLVAVLDPRLAEANYRTDLLAELPPLRTNRRREGAVRFVQEVVGAA